ncbi:MAG: YggS family pyridoxal phosphate-dependent enzyme [Nanoarchaeota archaeon]|nr:YggS family pyridoxal phosphate-dependent enzyme [Nanoarchaeota archaeon]
MMGIKENYEAVLKKIETVSSGRQIHVVVVTKTHPAELVNEAILAGAKIIGENKIQEAEDKLPAVEGQVRKHFIGHLQTNKAKKASELFCMIQSLDSEKLACEIDKRCEVLGRVMPVLIEVNISGEEQKFGINPRDVHGFIKKVSGYENIIVEGLMGVAPFVDDETVVREGFRKLKQIYDRYASEFRFKYLSMGMTEDYMIAIQEGSNMVRIGRAIFGERN